MKVSMDRGSRENQNIPFAPSSQYLWSHLITWPLGTPHSRVHRLPHEYVLDSTPSVRTQTARHWNHPGQLVFLGQPEVALALIRSLYEIVIVDCKKIQMNFESR